MNAIAQALQLLESAGKASTTIPRDLATKALTNPMSLYSGFKEDPRNAMMGAVMGMATPVKPSKLKMISTADRDLMGEFVQQVEQGNSGKDLGSLGVSVQDLIEGLGLKKTASNKSIANMFNDVVKMMDRRNIAPIQEK